jgi:glycine cleavage system H protein
VPKTREDVQYHPEHMWARLEGTRARIGITDFAQDALSVVVYVDLPQAGIRVQQGQPCGKIESTKTVIDLIASVTGTVVERNEALQGDPELVNRDPYGGWMLLAEVDGDPTGLLSAHQYAEQTGRPDPSPDQGLDLAPARSMPRPPGPHAPGPGLSRPAGSSPAGRRDVLPRRAL